jgi:hypothetical protein
LFKTQQYFKQPKPIKWLAARPWVPGSQAHVPQNGIGCWLSWWARANHVANIGQGMTLPATVHRVDHDRWPVRAKVRFPGFL